MGCCHTPLPRESLLVPLGRVTLEDAIDIAAFLWCSCNALQLQLFPLDGLWLSCPALSAYLGSGEDSAKRSQPCGGTDVH